MTKRKQKLFEDVRIVDTGHKGYAVGKTSTGETVFVQGAVPGDRVNVLASRKRKGVYFCQPRDYLEYSEHRTNPLCQHFGVCGGCKWQHMTYPAQLHFKERTVTESLRRIAHIPEPPVRPILGCEDPFHYRNKMEYTFTDRKWLTEAEMDVGDKELDRRGLGLHVSGAFAHVADLSECLLQPDPANSIRNFVREFTLGHNYAYQNLRYHEGLMRNLIIRDNLNGEHMVTIVFGEEDERARVALLDAIQSKFNTITSLYYCINTKLNDSIFDLDFVHVSGEEYLNMQLGHIEYQLGPKSFFQTNSRQAERMCQIVHELAGLKPDMLIYDLYCGIGSFALYLAREVRQVVGVEFISEAIEDARLNAGHNGIDNTAFYAGDVRDLLQAPEIIELGKPDVIITDPPRAGMDARVVQALLECGASRIVYISCNPATQARDLELLAPVYEVKTCQPIDMFPQTAHVENVALLERRKV